jgi:hypothetical protein
MSTENDQQKVCIPKMANMMYVNLIRYTDSEPLLKKHRYGGNGMRQPISVFIMDVGSSSKFPDPYELTDYLGHLCSDVYAWTDGIIPTIAKQRLGDEILLVSEGFATAYLIASHIYTFWKYPQHKPYFGLTQYENI